jgi:hypothetical protein
MMLSLHPVASAASCLRLIISWFLAKHLLYNRLLFTITSILQYGD